MRMCVRENKNKHYDMRFQIWSFDCCLFVVCAAGVIQVELNNLYTTQLAARLAA